MGALLRLVCVAVVGVTVAVGVAGAIERADPGCTPRWWPQPRQSACANGSALGSQALSAENVAGLQLAWTYEPGGAVGQPVVWKGPAMRAPFVYFVSGGKLHAVELATGRMRWKALDWKEDPVDGPASVRPVEGTQPVADGDVLLAASPFALILHRYVPRSGHLVWRRTLDHWNPSLVARQVIADRTWYAIMGDGLVAYDARTGKARWTHPLSCVVCGVAAVGGRVYAFGAPSRRAEDEDGGVLLAIDAQTGETVWSAEAAGNLPSGTSPALAGGRVFVRTYDGNFEPRFAIDAFRASDGARVWRRELATANDRPVFPAEALVADADVVVHAGEDDTLYVLDAKTGELRWKQRDVDTGIAPALVNGLVWAGDLENRLVAFDVRDGRRLWASSPFKARTLGSPVVAEGFVLVGTRDGRLLAYRVGS